MAGLTSSALLGSPYSRPGNILLGAPTLADAAITPSAMLVASAGMHVVAPPPHINSIASTVSMLASQPWTKWADHLHAKAFQ